MEESKIFSSEYSEELWNKINAIQYDEVKEALYLIECRLQEFEAKVERLITPGTTNQKNPAMKIIKVHDCISCPYSQECLGEWSCKLNNRPIKDFRVMNDVLPEWCPLEDMDTE